MDAGPSHTNTSPWIPFERLPKGRFQENLALLKRTHPELAPLFTAKPSRPVEVRQDEFPWMACRMLTPQGWIPIHGNNMPVAREIDRLMIQVPRFWDWGGQVLYLYQAGMGLTIATNRHYLDQDPSRRIVVIQDELSPLFAGMALYDFRNLFESEQILWFLGPEIQKQLPACLLEHHLAEQVYYTIAGGSALADQPGFPSLSGLTEIIRSSHNTHHQSQTANSRLEIRRYYQDHDLFRIRKVLGLNFYPRRPGGWILKSITDAMQRLGLEVQICEESAQYPDKSVFQHHILHRIAETKPDLLVTIMFGSSEYLLPEVFDELPIPRAVYMVDHELPTWGKFGRYDLVVLPMAEMSGVLEQYTHVETDFLPIVAHFSRSGRKRADLEVPLSFVGGITSIPPEDFQTKKTELERAYPGLWEVVEELVRGMIRCERKATLYEMVDRAVKNFDPPLSLQARWAVLFLANRMSSDLYRQRLLESIVRFQPWIFAGDASSLNPRSPLLPHLKGRIEPNSLPDLYASSAINLNLHAPGNTHTPSDRVFNVARAGGFQLCDPLLNLSDFYSVPDEVPTFCSEEDLAEKIAYYLNHPREREESAARSCVRTEKHYHYENWVRGLFEIVQHRLRGRFDHSRELDLPFRITEDHSE
ncbi:MAG TPA: glycosyltransferase [bacterium]|nr:glycosyltransferase [bacterium]